MSNNKLFTVPEQQEVTEKLANIIDIFKKSRGKIRPHFILTGATGTGKSANIEALAKSARLNFLEINAAQLTAEGVSGNSLSKALSPLAEYQNELTICFVDEFDKLFVRGAGNSSLSNESTVPVQNEFLKILEADTSAVFGDYGKYVQIDTSNVLYVFAGAFNGAKEINTNKLKTMGIRPEFLGRVNILYEMPTISLDSYINVLKNHQLIKEYSKLFPEKDVDSIMPQLIEAVEENFESNVIGLRMLTALIHAKFI